MCLTYLGCRTATMYKTRIHDTDDLRKCLMQTWSDCEQDIINAAIDQWSDRLRSYVQRAGPAGGGHFEHML